MSKLFLTAFVILILILLPSCKDQYDFSTDNLTEVKIETDIAIPLVNASFTLDEFLQESDSVFFEIDDENFMTLVFSFPVKEITAPEFFEGDYSGTLEEINYDIETQKFELGLDKLLDYEQFYVANPRVIVKITNYWDIPAQLKFLDFYYFPTETSAGIPVAGTFIDDWHSLNRPELPAIYAITDLIMDASNSSIDDMISSMPNYVTVGGLAQTVPGFDYQVDPNSIDSISMRIELPLELRVSNLNMTDTIEFDAIKDLGSDTGKFESIRLNLVFENGFPLDIDGQVYFMDETHTILDSVSIEPITIPSGTVSDGKVSTPARYVKVILIEGLRKDALFRSAFLKTRFTFSTANHQLGETIKIYADYQIDLKIGALARLKL